MSTDQIVALLVVERDKLNRAVEALSGPAKRRGRPPKNGWTFHTPYSSATVLEPASTVPTPAKKKRRFSAKQRAAAAERMRLRWAVKRKAGKKT